MNHRRLVGSLLVCLAALLAGCATKPPFDYANFRANPPRSILILPPINESTAVEGTYGYLSTVTRPVAELGYYVFPVAIVDQLFKENGMPTAGEMHQAPLQKVLEITGADAVLFTTLEQYGTSYQVLASVTQVKVKARLVDTRTGIELWSGTGVAAQGSGASGDLIADIVAAAVVQAIGSSTDQAHDVSRLANRKLLFGKDDGLPIGPYSPDVGKLPY